MNTYYTIYKITNQINGKIYIGSHKTKNLNDSYMGSGKYLKHAQEKHGIENFTKEILFIFDNPEEMYAKEAEIVNEDFLAEENTYNLKVGGFGGWDYANKNCDISNRNMIASRNGNNLDKRANTIKRLWAEGNYKDVNRENFKEAGKTSFLGKIHSDETKIIIGQKNSLNRLGQKNSQYGTKWIHSISEMKCKKIKKDSLIPEGWCEGRKMF